MSHLIMDEGTPLYELKRHTVLKSALVTLLILHFCSSRPHLQVSWLEIYETYMVVGDMPLVLIVPLSHLTLGVKKCWYTHRGC